MTETIFDINGTLHRPKNADEIGFKFDYTRNNWQEAEITVDRVILANKAYDVVKSHINTIGHHEGIPYSVTVGSVTIDYYVDLTDNPIYRDNEVEVSLKRRRGVDWFEKVSQGLSFEAINAKNTITGAFDVPYIIVKDNQVELLIMLAISSYTLTKELIQATKELADATGELVEALTPDVPPNVKPGEIANVAIQVAANAIYVALLIIALINLITQIVELIIPKVRYFKGNTFRSLISQGLQHPEINLSFSSSLPELDSTFLPVPLLKQKQSIFDYLIAQNTQAYNKGYPSASDSVFANLLGMINEVCKWLNAEYRIIDGVLYIENESFWSNNSGVNITTTLEVQPERTNEWTYNFDETWRRYYLHAQYDPSDTHTFDKSSGIYAEYQTEPITIINDDLVNIPGLRDVGCSFAYGARKNQLNAIELQLLPLAQLADNVVNFLGGNSNLAGKIVNRVGVLQISQQFFSIPKVIWTVGGKQPSNYFDIIGMPVIYSKYHSVEQVKENFKEIRSSEVRFSPEQFYNILDNNFVNDQFGNTLKIVTFEWINKSRKALIQYSIESDEASNLKTVTVG
jgi:hypothetical protein